MATPAILTITVNPAIDVSTSVSRLTPFSKLRCGDAKRDPGGGGINVARVLRRLGVDAAAIYVAGGPTGDQLKSLVDREGIASFVSPIAGDTREDFTVFEEETGRQFRFVLPGPSLSESESTAVLAMIDATTKPSRMIVASGSLPPHAPVDFYARIARRANEHSVRLVLDASGPGLAEALTVGAYLIKPNLRELRQLTGRGLDSESAWLDACRTILKGGRVEIVALTLGEGGALVVTQDQAWRLHAPTVRVVSTVGAGDSFLGAMVWQLMSGAKLADASRYAVAAGTAALLAPGTDLCRPQDVHRLLPQVALQSL